MSETQNTPSVATSVVNYFLNRFMPYILVASILFYTCGFSSLVPYSVIGLMWFASHFSFGCGVASVLLENELKSLESKVLLERLEECEAEKIDESEKKEEE